MTRDEQLVFCRTCKNKQYDAKIGIICGITDRVADFDGSCINYEEDISSKEKYNANLIENELLMNEADKGVRFANYILDIIFFWIFSFIFGALLGIILAVVSPSALASIDPENKLISYLLGFIAGVIYYSTLEALTGRTIAKYITKTKVVDKYGQKPNYETILIRTICRFIPFEAFSFLGESNSGWHDRLSKTKVVNVK